MKLRAPLSCQQFLFAAGCALLLLPPASGEAQTVRFKMRGGALQEGTFVGTDPTGVKIQVGGQAISLPPAAFETFEMAPPPEYRQGFDAFTSRDYPVALAKIRTVTTKFKGLPTTWAKYATDLLGDIYLAMDDLPKAEAAFNDARRSYPTPGGGAAIAEIGPARILVKKKDFAGAKARLDPITAEALREKTPPAANAQAYSQAFVASGMVKEAEGDLPGALEDYLRTVTIFFHDPAAVSVAQEHADTLRARDKQRPVTVP